jgi:hypothetical protein
MWSAGCASSRARSGPARPTRPAARDASTRVAARSRGGVPESRVEVPEAIELVAALRRASERFSRSTSRGTATAKSPSDWHDRADRGAASAAGARGGAPREGRHHRPLVGGGAGTCAGPRCQGRRAFRRPVTGPVEHGDRTVLLSGESACALVALPARGCVRWSSRPPPPRYYGGLLTGSLPREDDLVASLFA